MILIDRIKDAMMGTQGRDRREYPDRDEFRRSEYYEGDEEYEETSSRGYGDTDFYDGRSKSSKRSNVIDFNRAHVESKSSIVFTYPEDLDDARIVCDNIKSNKACVVILEGIDKITAQRIADFVSGSVTALNGAIERINNVIFMAAPESFDFAGDVTGNLKTKGFTFLKASNFR